MTKVAATHGMSVREFLEDTYRPRSQTHEDFPYRGENKMTMTPEEATRKQHRLEMKLLIAGVVAIVIAVTLGTLYLRAIEDKACSSNPIVCQM